MPLKFPAETKLGEEEDQTDATFSLCCCLQGWEESCDAAVSHLLRSCLSRSSKDQATTLAPAGGPLLGLPRDIATLKRHITLLCERLAKGGRLSLSSETQAQVPAQVQSLAAPGQ